MRRRDAKSERERERERELAGGMVVVSCGNMSILGPCKAGLYNGQPSTMTCHERTGMVCL